MFDTYRLGMPSINIKVEDKTAAVDSARLYGELLEKARTEVLEEIRVENSLLNFRAVSISTDSLTTKFGLAFTLNGKLITKIIEVNAKIVIMQGKDMLVRTVARIIAEELAQTLIDQTSGQGSLL